MIHTGLFADSQSVAQGFMLHPSLIPGPAHAQSFPRALAYPAFPPSRIAYLKVPVDD